MKKWTAYVALISLLLVGTFVTYKEAFARPWDCGMVEDICVNDCFGGFDLGDCEDHGWYIECEWFCDIGPWPPWCCPWGGSRMGICWL